MIALNKRLHGLLACISFCTALSTLSSVAAAQSTGEELIEAARCYACHQMTDYSLAPPYIAIAARHAPRKDVMVDVLASKIVHGGGGNWGVVPMVPNQWVSLDEARVMAAWILSLADQ
jgi:cytochrome c